MDSPNNFKGNFAKFVKIHVKLLYSHEIQILMIKNREVGREDHGLINGSIVIGLIIV